MFIVEAAGELTPGTATLELAAEEPMLEALEPSMVEAVLELAGRVLELTDVPEVVPDMETVVEAVFGPCDSVGAVKELPDIPDTVLGVADMTGEVFKLDVMVAAPLELAGINGVTLEPTPVEAVLAPLPDTTLEAPVPAGPVIDPLPTTPVPLPTTPVADDMPEAEPVATTEELLTQEVMYGTDVRIPLVPLPELTGAWT